MAASMLQKKDEYITNLSQHANGGHLIQRSIQLLMDEFEQRKGKRIRCLGAG
ncbi:hypothetical protein C1H46_020623 [Malus baccata]|uniref:Uncharacterized protein n=1 Tax=Malus baccata TaxID=106549 RepID=A0A540M4Y0_MALBA|nr:hypothetical protein C1H46_020623 [Malus baccata]